MSREEIEQKKKEIEKWLDLQITVRTAFESIRRFNNCIEVTDATELEEGIHIYRNLEILAFYLGTTVVYDPTWSGDYGKFCFWYKGVQVYQIYKRVKEDE